MSALPPISQSQNLRSSAAPPLVSVVLPVYQGAAFLDAALQSLLAQRFSDFEILIIDDGSQDESCAIAQTWAQRDRRIVLISREHRGLVPSLNEGIALSRGRFIARMDADDICLPGRLQNQLAWLRRTGADICGGWISLFAEKAAGQTIRYYAENEAIRLSLLFGAAFAHPAVVAKREVFIANPYREIFAHAEDYELWLRLASRGYKMTNYPGTVLRYRSHAAQISVRARLTQEENRIAAALHYQKDLGAKLLDADTYRKMIVHYGKLSRADVLAALNGFVQLVDSVPTARSGVIRDHAFLFLLRHPQVRLTEAWDTCRRLRLDPLRTGWLCGLMATRRT